MEAAEAMREVLAGRPAAFDVERDFPLLIGATRAKMKEQWGDEVDSPVGVGVAKVRAVHSGTVGTVAAERAG